MGISVSGGKGKEGDLHLEEHTSVPIFFLLLLLSFLPQSVANVLEVSNHFDFQSGWFSHFCLQQWILGTSWCMDLDLDEFLFGFDRPFKVLRIFVPCLHSVMGVKSVTS